MSQFGRDPFAASEPRPTCTLLGIIKEMHTVDQRNPAPADDYAIVEVVNDPLNIGMAGTQRKLFLTAAGRYDANVQMANSIYGLQYGVGPRRPAVVDQMVAFEKCQIDADGNVHARFLKTGGGPAERMTKMAVAFAEEWATVSPARLVGDKVKQTMMLAFPKEASIVGNMGDLEAAIDEARRGTVIDDGRSMGWPAFLLLSRRLPPTDAPPDFFADIRTRAASAVIMSPQPSSHSTVARVDFEPMATGDAMRMVHAGQINAIRQGESGGWVHEFVPGLAMPMAETAVPSIAEDGTRKGMDRSGWYTVYDRDEGDGLIKPATTGFAQSVVMAQCSRRTGGWVATMVTPSSSNLAIVPMFEMVTPLTHPGYRLACIEEIRRVQAIDRERMRQKNTRASLPRQMPQPQSGASGRRFESQTAHVAAASR